MWSTYQKLRDIIDLEIVQWGNTLGDGTLQGTTCQHGAVECRVQRVYACNKYRTHADEHASFVKCFDDVLLQTFPAGLPEPSPVNRTFADAALHSCATQLHFSYAFLDRCASGAEGEGFFVREKVKTPAHRGVPFVTLDGGAILYNSPSLDLLAEVCKAYMGSPKPAACTAPPSSEVEARPATASLPVPRSPYAYTSLLSPATDIATVEATVEVA